MYSSTFGGLGLRPAVARLLQFLLSLPQAIDELKQFCDLGLVMAVLIRVPPDSIAAEKLYAVSCHQRDAHRIEPFYAAFADLVDAGGCQRRCAWQRQHGWLAFGPAPVLADGSFCFSFSLGDFSLVEGRGIYPVLALALACAFALVLDLDLSFLFQAVPLALSGDTLVTRYAFTVLEKRTAMIRRTCALSFLFWPVLRTLHSHRHQPYSRFLFLFAMALRLLHGRVTKMAYAFEALGLDFSLAFSNKDWPGVFLFGVIVVIASHVVVVTTHAVGLG